MMGIPPFSNIGIYNIWQVYECSSRLPYLHFQSRVKFLLRNIELQYVSYTGQIQININPTININP